MINRLINDDCFNVLPNIQADSLDFIFVDLPYSQTENSWECTFGLEHLWTEYKRMIKPNDTIFNSNSAVCQQPRNI